jgi:hypothetical protein
MHALDVHRQCVGTLLLIFENPPQLAALNANGSAEGFVRSVKEECLNRVIPLRSSGVVRTVGHTTSWVPSAPTPTVLPS